MGDIAVDIFLETLKQLITSSKLRLIIEEKHQLQSLEKEIKYLRRFLKVTEKKRYDHPKVMKLVMQIRDLVSEAENIVELYVVHTFRADQASYFLCERKDHALLDHPTTFVGVVMLLYLISSFFPFKKIHQDLLLLDLASVKKRMETPIAEVKKIYNRNMYNINGVKQLEHSSTGNGGGSGSSRGSHTSKVAEEEVVVGFEEEVERLIEKLADGGEGRPLDIISIIGAGGGGKSTLARKVYNHPFTSYTFDIRAWINVSQDYDKTRKRELLIRILEAINPGNYEDSSEDKLGEDLLKCLKGTKYLIVMDDIWDIEAWNDIQRSFPRECKGSKVLFTSRQLVQLDNVGYFPHYLADLPNNRCWELLQKKVFGMKCCPPELVDIGKQIAEKCKGLPLAVVTIAGILKDKTLDVWEKVAKHLSSIIAKNEEAGCMEILKLSYNHLPFHLKACFLYIGGYPEDKEIPVRELIWLWIAEGFIQQSEGGTSLETIAEDYLIGLVDRSLVQVATRSPLGGIKTCRIHDLLRELCLKKAEDDNFLTNVYEGDSFAPFVANKHRRLFVGDQFFDKFSLRSRSWSRSRSQNLRSFVCTKLSGRFLTKEVDAYLSFSEENFELLRVLSFTCRPQYGYTDLGQLVHWRYLGLRQLVHLRYLSFASFNNKVIPFPYLLNLETLNLHLFGGIELPRDIFKMVKLRHLYTKHGIFTFHHSSKENGGNDFDHSSKLDSLQTLQRICTCEACRSLVLRTPNLRKLGLHVGWALEDNVFGFLELEHLKCLEKLSFTDALEEHTSPRKSTLLPGLKLPMTITRIIFEHTHLNWEELSLLQTLPSLEVLRLMSDACCEPVWNTSELDGFPQLKYLKFYNLDIKEWIATEDQFPKLEVLVLEYCRKLERIPIAFGNLNELREIKLQHCRRSAEESAKEIQKEQRNRKGDDECLNLLAKGNFWP